VEHWVALKKQYTKIAYFTSPLLFFHPQTTGNALFASNKKHCPETEKPNAQEKRNN